MQIISILLFGPLSLAFDGGERRTHTFCKELLSSEIDIHIMTDISAVDVPNQEIEGIPSRRVSFPVLTSVPWCPGNHRFWKNWCAISKNCAYTYPTESPDSGGPSHQHAMLDQRLTRLLNAPSAVRVSDRRFAWRLGDFSLACTAEPDR